MKILKLLCLVEEALVDLGGCETRDCPHCPSVLEQVRAKIETLKKAKRRRPRR